MDAGIVLDGFDKLVGRVESSIGSKIVVDEKIFHEVLLCAKKSLDRTRIDGIRRPHDYKKAGHYAFWLRKLKPFRTDESPAGTSRPSWKYVNEIIAAWTGIAFVLGPSAAREMVVSANFLRDMLAGLRYDAYTPDGLSLLFEAIGNQNRSDASAVGGLA
jgi:hypothetical protein